MPHIVYQTEGIVLGEGVFGEADKALTVFTREFGKIRAVATGVRYLKSKLRYNLGIFSYSRFGLIAGKFSDKKMWRIIDADEVAGRGEMNYGSKNSIVFARLTGFLNRMVQGEERNDFLWNKTREVFSALSGGSLSEQEMDDLEISFLLETLENLGYADNVRFNSRSEAITAINRGIKESML